MFQVEDPTLWSIDAGPAIPVFDGLGRLRHHDIRRGGSSGPLRRQSTATRPSFATEPAQPGPKATCWPPAHSHHRPRSPPKKTGRSPPPSTPSAGPSGRWHRTAGWCCRATAATPGRRLWSSTRTSDTVGGLSRTITRRDARGQTLESWEDKGAPAIDPLHFLNFRADGARAIRPRSLRVRRRRPHHRGRDPRQGHRAVSNGPNGGRCSSTLSVSSSPTPSPSTAPATARSLTRTLTPLVRPGALSFR